MRKIERSNIFKRDFKRYYRGRYHNVLETGFPVIVLKLANDEILAESNRDHDLSGEYRGFRECHIRPDLLLIYRKTANILELYRLGTHSELFG